MGRYDDDIDEVDSTEEAPKPSMVEELASTARTISRGWAAVEETRTADSPFAQRLKLSEASVVVKFLEDEPYASWRQHWVKRNGQQSFTCIADFDPKGCPLCDMGNRPNTKFAFNVVLLASNSAPVLRSYEIGPRAIDQLKNFHVDPRQGPLTKHYWAISRTGKDTTSLTNHQLVKERDLEEEWSLAPVNEATLKRISSQAYGPEIIEIPNRKSLQSIAIEESGD